MVIRLQRKMGENTERRKGTEAVTEKDKDHVKCLDAFTPIRPFAESHELETNWYLRFVHNLARRRKKQKEHWLSG